MKTTNNRLCRKQRWSIFYICCPMQSIKVIVQFSMHSNCFGYLLQYKINSISPNLIVIFFNCPYFSALLFESLNIYLTVFQNCTTYWIHLFVYWIFFFLFFPLIIKKVKIHCSTISVYHCWLDCFDFLLTRLRIFFFFFCKNALVLYSV